MNPVRSEERKARMARSERCVSGGQMDQTVMRRATNSTFYLLESRPGPNGWGGGGSGRSGTGMTQLIGVSVR